MCAVACSGLAWPDGRQAVMLTGIHVEVRDHQHREKGAQLLRREVVVRQAGLAPIQRQIRTWLDLLKARALVAVLAHRHKDEAACPHHADDLLR